MLRNLAILVGAVPALPCIAVDLKLFSADIPLSGPRAAQQLLLIEDDAGKAVADRTAAAKFTSGNPNVAVVDEAGMVTPVGDGETTITATANGKSAIAKVPVSKAKDPTPPNFRNDRLPILTRAGCHSRAFPAAPP